MTELLIVGALTIDRFADGRPAPGGSVLHAGLAAVAEGVRPTFLTVGGDEPEALDGLARLAAMGDLIHQPASRTASFGHDERAGRRVLVYEAAPGVIRAPAGLDAPDVLLLAPIADELPAPMVLALRPRYNVMLIQGWLRRLVVGVPVRTLPLDEVSAEVWDAFRAADAIVVSTEDLAETPEDPFSQAAALRARIGARPLLFVTMGTDGYLLDDPAVDRAVASVPRRVVENVPMVGAGDTFGAALAIHLGRGAAPAAAVIAAADRVLRMLESRAK